MYQGDQYYKAKAEFHIFLGGVQKIQECVVVIMCGVAEQATGLKVDNVWHCCAGSQDSRLTMGVKHLCAYMYMHVYTIQN